MYIKIITVSELSGYIKKVIDSDFILNNTHVKGEISNLKSHSSGHLYFSLKDDFGKINCIMFKTKAETLKFQPENGMEVIVKGKVSVYLKDGAYQLYCNEMELQGIGELSIAFEKLKAKLENEGLFNEDHKKPIPMYAKNIGVITSPTGAAVKDIINVATRRNPGINITIYPALVQGKNSPEEIVKGISNLNKIKDIDVILLSRGGGSIEELWSFNDEKLAYAIYNSKKPIVSAVGHETDFTIADFVSDFRAPTPSAGAEIISFSVEEASRNLEAVRNLLNKYLNDFLMSKRDNLKYLEKIIELNSPMAYIANFYSEIDNKKQILTRAISNRLNIEKETLSKLNALLHAHNPINVLNKGYAVIEDDEQKLILQMKDLICENKVKITLKDGSELFKIRHIEQNN